MAYTGARTVFPTLREVVGPAYEVLPDPELAEHVEAALGIPAEIAENWFSDFGRTLSQRAPAILSGAMQGGMTGAPAGPYGMAAGALIGGISGALSGGGSPGGGSPPASRPPAPPAAPAPPSPAPPAPPVPGPAAPPGAPTAGGTPAAGAMLQLLANPDVQRALMSMMLGSRVGAPTVPVAGEQVSVAG